MVNIGNKWMLGGLTSFGRGCNDGGVYARTSNYYNWILQNLQQDQTLTTTTSAPNRKLNKRLKLLKYDAACPFKVLQLELQFSSISFRDIIQT